MKNLFKLTTAALALVAFASCSNDEFPNTQQAQPTTDFVSVFEYEMEAPEFDGVTGTRAARNANGGGFVYQEGDELRVYDEDLGTFDPYKFDTKFGRKNAKSNLKKDPKYALFPATDVRKGYCDGDGNHIAEIKIGTRMNAGAPNQFNKIEYSVAAGSETKVDETVVYQCNIPMWGEVTKVDDKTVKTKTALSPLSGVLMLTLGNTMGNAAWIQLSSTNGYLGGTFYANLDDETPALYVDDKNEYQDLTKTLYIDLRDVPSDMAVLYIPVVAGVNDLVVKRSSDTTDDPTGIGTWTTVTNESGYTFKRNGWHKVNYDYPIVAETPEQISIVLDQLSSQTEDMNLKLSKALQLGKTTTKAWEANSAWKEAKGGVDYNVYMPNMSAKVVTIDIANNVVTGSKGLNFVDADENDRFTGTLVIKNSSTSALPEVLPNIDLPEAKVVMIGDFSKWTVSSSTQSVVAKEFTLGDGSTTTTLGNSKAIYLGLVETSVNVLAKATYNGNVDLNKDAITKFATLTVNGKVAGNVDTKGDVEINTPDGALEAITGALKFYRGATTATIKQGFVATITNDFSALGEANNKTVTVDLDDANGITAIGAVTVVGSDAAINLTESTLSGKDIPSTIPAAYLTSPATNVYTCYTATQLEYIHKKHVDSTPLTVAGLQFGNDINMAKAAWKAPFLGGTTPATFTISSTVNKVARTIKNLSYNKYASSVAGIGFVGEATTLTVSDFALDKVSFNRAYVDDRSTKANTFEVAFVGTVAGKATTATLTNVSVNMSGNFGYKEYTLTSTGDDKADVNVNAIMQGIGGLVGLTGTATLNKVSVKGALIEGYTSLGGFIGRAYGDVTIDDKCKSAITAFKSNYSDPSATNIEMNFARIGGGIGYQALKSANVTVKNGATTNDVTVTLPSGGENKLYVKVAAGTGNKLYSFSRNQQWVGFSGTEENPALYNGIVTIGWSNYVSPTFNASGDVVQPTGTVGLYTWTAKAN